jgi:polyribonucleotide nucleotidyltransferase
MSTITRATGHGVRRRGRERLRFETGKLAKQADSRSSSAADTMISRRRSDARKAAQTRLLPLTIDVEERCAAGKVPGGFFKREDAPPSAPRSPHG